MNDPSQKLTWLSEISPFSIGDRFSSFVVKFPACHVSLPEGTYVEMVSFSGANFVTCR